MARDFKQELIKQMNFLHRSCLLFDQGFKDEGIRIAVVMRVLFHDTGNSVSLLTHLDAKEILLASMSYDDPSPGVIVGMKTFCIIQFSSDGTTKNIPDLDATQIQCFLKVDSWWNQTISVLDSAMSRKDYILAAANKDGGAHVDAVLDTKYVDSMKEIFRVGRRGEPKDSSEQPPSDTHLVSLRQMAFELLNSPELINLMS